MLCEKDTTKRSSVRHVRLSYPWIYDVFTEEENAKAIWSHSTSNIEFLKCATAPDSSPTATATTAGT